MTPTASASDRPSRRGGSSALKRKLGAFGGWWRFTLPIGSRVEWGATGGYYIDFTAKVEEPRWPPAFVTGDRRPLYVAITQWALGCYERFLAEEDERWLAAAQAAGDYLVAKQYRGGRLDGGLFHHTPYPHTFALRPPWLSGIAQGQAASLLVRLHRVDGSEALAEAARRMIGPLSVPAAEGGVQALLDGRPFPEEYPTNPPSHVLNGGIFGLWGLRDVGVALDDPESTRAFEAGLEALVGGLPRWDLGHWSRYDLFPHPVSNVATVAYHELHINQLRAMAAVAPHPRLETTAARFARYAEARRNYVRALAEKVLFRVLVPRNPALSRWLRRARPATHPSLP